jgi:alpha-amylase
MASITLSLIVHDHQPVGNFDGVIAAACDDAYDPFLDFLERHPRFRLAMHLSGPLLEWLAAHRHEHLARLRALVVRGQVEPWGGAFYEPVLPGIPEIDRQGQIRRMSDWIEEELGVRPRGLWLAERVWEPALAATLARAGLEYTAVDDAHFLAAGLTRDQLWGAYLTEDEGERLRVLPIRRELRYLIPFQPPERAVAWLRDSGSVAPGRLAVLGDDGEKFGLWPGTRDLCWRDRWLERFADALDAAPEIEMRPPGEALDEHATLGLAYLPSPRRSAASAPPCASWSPGMATRPATWCAADTGAASRCAIRKRTACTSACCARRGACTRCRPNAIRSGARRSCTCGARSAIARTGTACSAGSTCRTCARRCTAN